MLVSWDRRQKAARCSEGKAKEGFLATSRQPRVGMRPGPAVHPRSLRPQPTVLPRRLGSRSETKVGIEFACTLGVSSPPSPGAADLRVNAPHQLMHNPTSLLQQGFSAQGIERRFQGLDPLARQTLLGSPRLDLRSYALDWNRWFVCQRADTFVQCRKHLRRLFGGLIEPKPQYLLLFRVELQNRLLDLGEFGHGQNIAREVRQTTANCNSVADMVSG